MDSNGSECDEGLDATYEDLASNFSDLNQITGEVASQMLTIGEEVSKLQEEIMALKADKLSDMLEELELTESDKYFPENIDTAAKSTNGLKRQDSDYETPTSPVLKKASSYGTRGRLEQGIRRRISWSPSVVDNEKGPGEDSLSTRMKRRSKRNRSSDSNSALSIVMYCIVIYLLSNWIPRLLEHFLNSSHREQFED